MIKTVLCTACLLALLLFAACANENIAVSSITQTVENTSAPSSRPAAPAKPVASATPVHPATSPEAAVPQHRTFLAYVKCDVSAAPTSGKALAILADEILWIDGDDEQVLLQYGIAPDDVNNDYAIVNEAEEWEPYLVAQKAAFFVQYTQDYELDPREIGWAEFAGYLAQAQDYGILAEITVAEVETREVIRIAEIYTP